MLMMFGIDRCYTSNPDDPICQYVQQYFPNGLSALAFLALISWDVESFITDTHILFIENFETSFNDDCEKDLFSYSYDKVMEFSQSDIFNLWLINFYEIQREIYNPHLADNQMADFSLHKVHPNKLIVRLENEQSI